jgi:chromosome segregation ATPase
LEDLNKRLEAASKRRDSLASEARRIEGRLEVAEANLLAVEAECRGKGIDPDNIDAVIERLKVKYEDLVVQVEREVASADAALAPFLKEQNS